MSPAYVPSIFSFTTSQRKRKLSKELGDMKQLGGGGKASTRLKLLWFYTSVSSFTVLMAMFNLVSAVITETPQNKLSKFQCYVLTLIKLRLNASNYDLGFRFGISTSTVSQLFSKWIEAMDIQFSFPITWPDRESIQKAMPFCFRPNYGLSVISILVCFELYIEKPTSLLAKSCTW